MERMSSWAARLEPGAYSALRIVAGLMFSLHGMQKLFGWFGSPMHPPVLTLPWFAGVIELACGVLIALGLFTRPAAFLAAGQMAVAYFAIHWKLSFGGGQWAPLVNHGELAALYSLLFLFVFAYGPGLFSLDGLVRRPSERQPRGRPVRVGPLAGEHGGGE